LNDCWQGPSWSSIDYYGRWKALHYIARRFFAPLLISGLEDANAGTVEVHVTSDLAQEQYGEVRWRLTTTDGTLVKDGQFGVSIAPYRNTHAVTLDLKQYVDESGARNLLIWLEVWMNGELVSDNLVLFARPKHLTLREPELQLSLRQVDERHYQAEVTAKHPALWVWLSTADGDCTYSDNFFALLPGSARMVEITTEQPTSLDDLRQRLSVQSLVDTFKEEAV
jgi:beta-mannosidase